MYRSMIIGEGEKIRSIPFKHILIFVGLVVCAGLIFRFGFMKIFHNMNKHNIRTFASVKEIKVVEKIKEVEKIENVVIKESRPKIFDIVGKVNNYYIVKTFKGLKRVKIGKDNIKSIGDQIIIDKL